MTDYAVEKMNNQILEANLKLLDENKLLKEDKEILKRRIGKAIEYIEKNTEIRKSTFYGLPDYEVFNGYSKDVLEILKGEYIYE